MTAFLVVIKPYLTYPTVRLMRNVSLVPRRTRFLQRRLNLKRKTQFRRLLLCLRFLFLIRLLLTLRFFRLLVLLLLLRVLLFLLLLFLLRLTLRRLLLARFPLYFLLVIVFQRLPIRSLGLPR